MASDNRIALSFVFGLVGGVLIITMPLLFLPFYYSPYGPTSYGPFFYGLFGFVIAIASGVLVIVGAAMTLHRPSQGLVWGIVIIVFGALSIFGLGGFIIGMALAITSGSLAIAAGTSVPAATPRGLRACLGCGLLVDPSFAHCPYCGHAMPSAPR